MSQDLSANKAALLRLQEEAKTVYSGFKDANGRINSVPARSALDKLMFSECCLRESLRLYSGRYIHIQ
jgi:hypothetical protein